MYLGGHGFGWFLVHHVTCANNTKLKVMYDYFIQCISDWPHGINTLLSKKFAWKINDLRTENLLDPVLNYTELTGMLASRPHKTCNCTCS